MASLATEMTKPTVLIVEDEPGPRDALRMILRPFFNLIQAESGRVAMRMLKEHQVDLVTLDLKLPDQQGIDLLQEIKLEKKEEVEVVIITGYGSLKSAMDGIRYGAAAYLLKPFNVSELITVLKQTLEKKQRLSVLREVLKNPSILWSPEPEATKAWERLMKLYQQGSVEFRESSLCIDPATAAPLLMDLLEAKDRSLYNHSSRTSFYTGLLAKHLNLSETEESALRLGAFLHDLGHIGLDQAFLGDPNLGSDHEREQYKRHAEIGRRIALSIHLPAEVVQIISYNHEQYDGSGFPDGLQGEGIPLHARVVHLADKFDHLTTEHGDHSLSVPEACEQLRRMSGAAFDPSLTDLFIRTVTTSKLSVPQLAASLKTAPLS